MPTTTRKLDCDGFYILHQAVDSETIQHLLAAFGTAFEDDSQSVRARSSRGHVYAARNLIESISEVTTVWQVEPMLTLLRDVLGDGFGLVRALFFDKPPERSWSLPWHKDTSIAVKDNSAKSSTFSRLTIKAGVPHVIASDQVLHQMLTLRIHLDEVTDENGPLRVIPGSHVASDSIGVGVDHAVTIRAGVGDVLAMRPLISHASGSSLEGTRRHRRILRGSLFGGFLVGHLGGGRYLSDNMGAPPSAAPTVGIGAMAKYEWSRRFKPKYGPPTLKYMATAPTPAAGAAVALGFGGNYQLSDTVRRMSVGMP